MGMPSWMKGHAIAFITSYHFLRCQRPYSQKYHINTHCLILGNRLDTRLIVVLNERPDKECAVVERALGLLHGLGHDREVSRRRGERGEEREVA